MSNVNKSSWDSIDDKLYTVKYRSDTESHLVPNLNDCVNCKDRPCTFFCPASVYTWDPVQEKLIVGFENCLECGACQIGCTFQSISWRYPKSGFGVTFKHG